MSATVKGWWLASRDGVAHYRRRERDPRTVCGTVAVAVVMSWPSRTRCDVCQRILVGGERLPW